MKTKIFLTSLLSIVATTVLAEQGYAANGDNPQFTTVSVNTSDTEMYIPGATVADFDSYVASLREHGYKLNTAKHSAGDNNVLSATFTGEKEALYVRWLPETTWTTSVGGADKGVSTKTSDPVVPSSLRVTCVPRSLAFLPGNTLIEFQKVCKTQGFINSVTAPDVGNGMSIFYLLADGTFLIYDGGKNQQDADYLYDQLRKVASDNNIEQIHIAAWVITHAHSDHTGFWKPFMNTYGEKVQVDNLFFNVETMNSAATTKTVLDNLPKNCKHYSLHSGQTFTLADVTVDVLYTVEDMASATPEGKLKLGYQQNSDLSNIASTVMRLTLCDGKTILMTGDAFIDSWDYMCSAYGTELKSDILQVAHHGVHNGMTIPSIDYISPSVLVYPGDDTLVNGVWTGVYTGSGAQRIGLYLRDNYGKEGRFIAGELNSTKGLSRTAKFVEASF